MIDNSVFNSLSQSLNKIILGQESSIRELLVALLTGGHVILEGVPGTGKTLLVKTIAKLISADFKRVQLTPDILPSDILGTNIFDFNSRTFSLKKGPIFTEILLADEINRTPPKTQAALLEGMEERQVTLDGETMHLPPLFWVIATQNSLEFEGTYPLPEAQLDRFLFKLLVDYPEPSAQKQMLLNAHNGFSGKNRDLESLQTIATPEDILKARQEVQKVMVEDNVLDYLLNAIEQTRRHQDLALGASPRCSVSWLQAIKASAWLENRDFVTPDDVKAIALPLLRHRLILKAEAQLDGVRVDGVVNGILQQVVVPR
jgi:MoxR-like ATPase